MRLATLDVEGRQHLGVVRDDQVVDVTAAAMRRGVQLPASMVELIAGGLEALQLVRRLVGAAREGQPLAQARLLAPIPRPPKNVICVGLNYKDHIEEGARARGVAPTYPEHCVFFTKPPTAIIGPDASICYDSKVTSKLDYEAELAFVIGPGGRDIAPGDAFKHVWGYTCVNDVSARDLQRAHSQFFKGKGLDTSCPMGPWIVTADEFSVPPHLDVIARVNGEVRQNSNTRHFLFDIPAMVSVLSAGMTLEPGDVISTGTPSGVGYAMEPPGLLQPGDVVEIEVEGVGILRNPVVAA